MIPPVVGISFDGVCLISVSSFFHACRFIMSRIFCVDTYALRVGMRLRTLQRPRFKLCFIDGRSLTMKTLERQLRYFNAEHWNNAIFE